MVGFRRTAASAMSGRFTSLAEKIPALLPRCAELRGVLGFDGTVDIICRAVRERFGAGEDFDPFERIRDFGEHIVKADGRSALIEIFRQREKIGGTSPTSWNLSGPASGNLLPPNPFVACCFLPATVSLPRVGRGVKRHERLARLLNGVRIRPGRRARSPAYAFS